MPIRFDDTPICRYACLPIRLMNSLRPTVRRRVRPWDPYVFTCSYTFQLNTPYRRLRVMLLCSYSVLHVLSCVRRRPRKILSPGRAPLYDSPLATLWLDGA